MQEGFEEFRKSVQRKGSNTTKMKVTNSFGVYDCYKAIRGNHWFDIGRPLKEGEFYSIIRGINKRLAENLANGETVTFPSRMGVLELRKYESGVQLVEGKLKITYPIDWNETIKLWYEDAEARKKKTLLRIENKFIYHIKYCKEDATYDNKAFYLFTLNEFIKRALKDNIKEGKIDTLW